MALAMSDELIGHLGQILRDPNTPNDLFNRLADFVCARSNALGDAIVHSDDYLRKVLGAPANEDSDDDSDSEPERKEAGWKKINEWASSLIKIEEPESGDNFMLLISEFQSMLAAGKGDPRLDAMMTSALQSAYAHTEHAWEARRELVAQLRAKEGLPPID